MTIPLTRRTLYYCLLAFALLFAVEKARAHDHGFGSWIGRESIRDPVSNEWCCNAGDCKEIVDTPEVDPATQIRGRVQQLPDGNYLVVTHSDGVMRHEVIEAKRVIWRSPGSWWRCHRPNQSTRCLLGPPPGS